MEILDKAELLSTIQRQSWSLNMVYPCRKCVNEIVKSTSVTFDEEPIQSCYYSTKGRLFIGKGFVYMIDLFTK